jgi:hypothetical protein
MGCHTRNGLASMISGRTTMPEQINARTLKGRGHEGAAGGENRFLWR